MTITRLVVAVSGWIIAAIAILFAMGSHDEKPVAEVAKLEAIDCCAAVDAAAAKGSYVTAKTQTCCVAKIRVAVAALASVVAGCAGCQNPNPHPDTSTGGSSSISTGGGPSIGGRTATGGANGTGGGSPLTKVDKACQNMLGKCPEVKDVASCVATINKINAGKVGNFDNNTLDCLGSAKTQKDVQACKGPVCGGVN